MKKNLLFVSAICLFTAVSTAHASTIVAGGDAPDQVNMWYADTAYAYTDNTTEIIPFTLSGQTLTGADWWGGCATGASAGSVADDSSTGASSCSVTSFVISFYPFSGGTFSGMSPVIAAATFTASSTGLMIDGKIPEFHYVATFTTPLILSGSYLFGVSASLLGPGTWGMETHGGEDNHFQKHSGTWETPRDGLAFDLFAADITPPPAVPEPATLSLVLIGAAGVALRKRRR